MRSAGFAAITALTLSLGVACSKKEEKTQLGFNQPSGSVSTQPKSQVRTAPVEAVEQSEVVRLTGTLQADERANVASKASGNVQEILVDRGSIVKKGDPLVRLDDTDAKNNLATGEAAAEELRVRLGIKNDSEDFQPESMPEAKQALSAMQLAERNYKRYEELSRSGSVAKAEYDRVKTEFESARERYDQALQQASQLYQGYKTQLTRLAVMKQSLEDTTVRAPFDGMVAEKLVANGERVDVMMGGGKVVSLVKINPLRLVLTVPQQNSGVVKPGQTVEFEVDSFPNKKFTGKISLISPSVDASSRSLTVEALVDNPNHELLPGFFATANLALGEKQTTFFVPETAVLRSRDSSRLFVVRDGVAHEKVVAAAEPVNGRVEVRSGLLKGDVVVVNPQDVQDGSPIQMGNN